MSKYLTINQLTEQHPCFTKGGMHHYVFNSKFNGLDKSGAIKRVGRRILIDVERFFQWIEDQNEKAS